MDESFVRFGPAQGSNRLARCCAFLQSLPQPSEGFKSVSEVMKKLLGSHRDFLLCSYRVPRILSLSNLPGLHFLLWDS